MDEHIEQLRYGFESQILPQWTLEAEFARELGTQGGALSHGGRLTYADDCFQFSTSITRTFYEDRDYKPGLTVMFRFTLKNLGQVEVNGNHLGLGQALRE